MITETGYHGTKRASAEAIKREGFRIKKPSPGSKKRKYGAGAYFFREVPNGYRAASRWAVKCFTQLEDPVVLKCPIEYDESLFLDFDRQSIQSQYREQVDDFMEKHFRGSINQSIDSRICNTIIAFAENVMNEKRMAQGKPPAKFQVILGLVDFRGDGTYAVGQDRHMAPAIVVRDASLIQHKEASILPCRREAYE